MNFKSNVLWVISTVCVALFFRVFVVSVYNISTSEMSPQLIPGDILISNQWSYGIRFPWQEEGYFSADPQVSDIIVYRVQKGGSERVFVKRIVQKTEKTYLVQADQEINAQLEKVQISRDQIIGKAWVVVLSIDSTQDSISGEKSVRWNRFLTLIR